MANGKATRRLAAIVAADVAGYSRLIAADEEITLASLRALRSQLIDPKIAEYRGRIANTAGDSLLVEFPSVVNALRCAVDVQRGMAERNVDVPEERRIRFRVGINLGDVIEQEGDLLGDGVNVAARLEGLAEPGGICLSRAARDQVRDRMEIALEDMGEVEIKNIARPVHVFRVLADGETPAVPSRRPGSTKLAAAAGLLLVCALVVGGLLWWHPWSPDEESAAVENMAFPLPDKPSIAVLPFANLSGDKDQEYFADGMTEDIITDLSKISGLFVISRNSTYYYKGRTFKISQVAEELGVRFVLEGSVRRDGQQVRINAQLIDSTTGGHIWAERYDGSLADVFGLQDEVTGKIVAALAVSLTPSEQEQAARQETIRPQAYDAFLKGWNLYRGGAPGVLSEASSHIKRAVELDPDYGRAYAALAEIHWNVFSRNWSWALPELAETCGMRITTECAFERAKEYVALAMKNPTPIAYRVSAAMAWRDWRHEDAVAEAEKALALDGNDPDNHVTLAEALVWAGRDHEALDHVERAMRLDPHYPPSYLRARGVIYFSIGRLENAASQFETALERNPEDLELMLWLAAVLAEGGRVKEARELKERFAESVGHMGIGWTVENMLQAYPFRKAAVTRRFGDGLAKAGLCCADDVEAFIERMRKEGKIE